MTRFATVAITLLAVLTLAADTAEARPSATSDTITLEMIANLNKQPAYDVIVPNFERVHPNIKVDVSYYADAAAMNQLESIELGAGNAPVLLKTSAGCGVTVSVCVLAKVGDLAPLVKAPWVKWSAPLVTSADKYGAGLYSFTPAVQPYGVYTNDTLFKRLGLKIPQTLPQLLALCQQAKANGTVAFVWSGASAASVSNLISEFAVASLYGQDPQWAGKLRAGSVSFDGTSGWHQALQTFVDIANAGCFQPGVTGTTGPSATSQFAQGQGLMIPGLAIDKGMIDAASPQFAYSFHPFPDGTPTQAHSYKMVQMSDSVGVNAHASAQDQAAAQTFIDFLARPKQNALYVQTIGGLTQYQFLHQQLSSYMRDFAPVFKQHRYVIAPYQSWWNANVLLALDQDTIGLITGQRSIDDVLNAMDAAWKQGPG